MHNLHTTCALPEITIIRLYSPLFKRSPLKEKVFMARRNGQEKMNSLRKCLPQKPSNGKCFVGVVEILASVMGLVLELLLPTWSYSPAVPVA